MIGFLGKFRFVAAVLVILSIPAYGLFALIPMLFCDSGPLSTCVRIAIGLVSIPICQIVVLVIGWVLFAKRRHLRVSATLMILSALPAFGPIVLLMKK